VKSSVESLGPTQVKITVEVPFEDLRPAIDAAYRKIGSQVKVQGFRPGKVPRPILDQRVGRGYVLEEALNDALPQLYSEAVQETEIRAVGRPEVEIGAFGDGEPLVFSATVDVRPEVTLPEYDGLPVTVDDAEVSEEAVAEQLAGLQDRFATLAAVDRPVEDGDYVSLDISATVDGELVEGSEATGLSYQVGSDSLLPGLDAVLVGVPTGESRTFDSDLQWGEYAGRTAAVEVTVQSVKVKQVPDLDDEFAKTASEFDTLDELKEDLRSRLQRVQRLQQGLQARDRTLEGLVERVDVPLPEAMVSAEVDWRHQRLEEDVRTAGMTLDQYLDAQGQTHDEFHDELRKGAERAVKAQLVLDAIADKEEIGVSDADLSDQVVRQAQRSGADPNQLAQHIVRAGQLGALVADVRREKALALVTQNAKISDEAGRPIDLEGLRDELGGGAAPIEETEPVEVAERPE
jgi:trigger factor